MTTIGRTRLRNFAAFAALVLSAGVASAADLAVQYNPPESYDWTGVFAGVEAAGIGASYAVTDATGNPLYEEYIDTFNGEFDMDGTALGARIGYHHQQDNLVLGIQGLVLAPRLEGGYVGELGDDDIAEVYTKVDWLAGVLGTAGYAFDKTMIYAGAGVAFGGISVDVTGISEDVELSAQQQQAGWPATVGIAHALSDNVFASLDFTHVDLGEAEYELDGTILGSPSTVTANGGGTAEILRVGLNFRF